LRIKAVSFRAAKICALQEGTKSTKDVSEKVRRIADACAYWTFKGISCCALVPFWGRFSCPGFQTYGSVH
jgi:hypothetical protein